MVTHMRDFVLECDFWGSNGSEIRERNNLLAGTSFEDGKMTLYSPEGVCSAGLIRGFLDFGMDKELGVFPFEAACSLPPTQGCSRVFILGAIALLEGGVVTWKFDCDTVFVPLGDCHEACHVLELFAGGYGGWRVACDHLQEHTQVKIQTIGIENCADSAYQYTVSHDAILLSGDNIPIDTFVHSCRDFLVLGDVMTDSWLPAVGLWRPDCICISAPCPPWSSAGSSEGLDVHDGRLFLRSLVIAKILRPSFLLLEQVAGFAEHQHKKVIMDMLKWSGYVVQWAKLVEGADQGPVHRLRWLCLASRVCDTAITRHDFQFWTKHEGINPRDFGAVLPEGGFDQDPRLYPTREVLQQAARHDLLPPAKRRHVTSNQALQSRCYQPTAKLPTFMAMYGNQHQLSEATLQSKGLLSHFLALPDGRLRQWHPLEVLLLHGTVGSHLILNDWMTAFRHLGNQIMTVHALLLLTNAMRQLPLGLDFLNLDEVIEGFLRNHHTFSSTNLHFQTLDFGILVWDKKGYSDVQLSCIRQGWTNRWNSLPHGHAWTTDGLVPLELLPGTTGVVRSTRGNPIETVHDSGSLTVPFETLRRVICQTGATAFSFRCSWSLKTEDIIHLFGGHWTVNQQMTQTGGDLVLDFSSVTMPRSPENSNLLILAHSSGLMLLDPESPFLNEMLQDQYGASIPKFGDNFRVYFDKPLPKIMPCEDTALSFHHAVECSQIFFNFLPEKATYRTHVHGPAWATRVIANFWVKVAPPETCGNIGLSVTKAATATDFCIDFSFDRGLPPLPCAAFRDFLFVLGYQACVGRCQSTQGVRVSIKFLDVLFDGIFNPAWTLDVFASLLSDVKKCFGSTGPFRILHLGKMQPLDYTLAKLQTPAGLLHLRLHCVFHLVGGAPTGTKSGVKTQNKNALAGVLLAEGYELAWVSNALEKLFQAQTAKEIANLVEVKGPDQITAVLRAFRDIAIDVPKLKPTVSSQPAAFKKKKEMVQPDPSEYQLVAGSLCNEDGSDTLPVADFGCKATGFYLTTPQASIPWLRANETLSTDELAMLIMGSAPVPTTLKKEEITLPFTSAAGQRVLIACTLIQFGDRLVTSKQLDPHRIQQDNSTMIALTFWRGDWDDAAWTLLVANPYKFVKGMPGAEAIVSLWGKSYRKGKQATTARDATSVQLHSFVGDSKVANFLSRTGFNLMFATPKTEEGRPSSEWKMLWLETKDIPDANVLASKIPDACGLVRAGNRLALRIPKDKFAAAWAVVYPSVPVPKEYDTTRIFKLESLPFGTTAAMLESWSQHLAWPIKPLRQLGARAWIIGTGSEPPAGPTSFNGQHVLIRELANKTPQATNPIVAGPKPAARTTARPDTLPQLQGDPWAKWTGPSAPQAAMAGPPRSVTGPTADKLAEQDNRIKQLEQSVQNIQAAQGQQSHALDAIKTEVQERDNRMKQHVDSGLAQLRNELDTSFTQAIRKQSQSFDTSLGEIKKLLLEKNKRKNTADGDDDMQG